MNHLCPFHRCTCLLPPEKFCCIRHWGLLSNRHKQTIHAAYADWKQGSITGAELRTVQQQILGARGDARKMDQMEATP